MFKMYVSTEKMSKRDEKGHWLPGVSGNPNGRPRDTFTPILTEKYSDEETVRVLVDKLHEMAAGGNMQAMSYVMDRFLGRPRQAMDIVADVNEAVGITIVRAGDIEGTSTDTAST